MTIEIVRGPGSVAAVWLLTYLLHSTVLIAGAWLVTRLLRRPRTRDVLWRLALFGGVVSASVVVPGEDRPRASFLERWESGDSPGLETLDVHDESVRIARASRAPLSVVSAPSAFEPSAPPATRGGARAVYYAPDLAGDTLRLRLRDAITLAGGGGAAVREEAVFVREGRPAEGAERSAAMVRVARARRSSGAACEEALDRTRGFDGDLSRRVAGVCGGGGFSWYRFLVQLWLAGALLALVPLVGSVRAVWALAAGSRSSSARVRALLDGLGPWSVGVRVVVSDALGAPCVLSGRRIGVPQRCEDELSDGELRAALAHELAHVVRRDTLWLGLGRFVRAVFWLQPLNRLALARAVAAAEELCDDWALSRTGERMGLANSISRVAEWVRGSPTPAAVVAMVRSEEGSLTARIRRILDESPTAEPRWHRLAAGALVALPLLWLPAVPRPAALHASFRIEGEVTGGRWVGESGGPEVQLVRVLVAEMEPR